MASCPLAGEPAGLRLPLRFIQPGQQGISNAGNFLVGRHGVSGGLNFFRRNNTVYPTAHIARGTGMAPADLSEVFLEAGRRRDHGPTAVPQRDDTPWAGV